MAAAPVGALAAADGGYFAGTWGWAALVLAWIALGALAVGRPALGREARLFGLGLAALTGWIWLSGAWSLSSSLSLLDAQRALVYLAGVAAVLLVGGSARATAAGTATAVVGASAYALATDAGSRLTEPIGYSNALGILAAVGALLLAGLVASRPRAVRALSVAGIVVALGAVYGAYGRGPWLALVAGTAVAVALSARPRGIAVRVAPVVLLVAAAGVALTLAGTRPSADRAAVGVLDPREELLTLASHDRSEFWSVAVRGARDRPLLGSGAGTFQLLWLRHRTMEVGVLDAHSVYLETLTELGPAGLALLVATLALPLVAALRARGRPLVATAAGAYVAFLVHAALDWDWELPAVTLAGLFAGCVVLRAASPRPLPLGGRERAAGGALLAVVAALAFTGLVGNGALVAAERALDAGQHDDAREHAARADAWSLWSVEPLRVQADAWLAAGARAEARAAFRRAARRDPENVRLWLGLAATSDGMEREGALRRARELDPLGVR